MDVESITSCQATITFDEEELRLLAKACAEASDKVDGRADTLLAMHGCFQALALAAHACDTPVAIRGRHESWAAYDTEREAAHRRLVEYAWTGDKRLLATP